MTCYRCHHYQNGKCKKLKIKVASDFKCDYWEHKQPYVKKITVPKYDSFFDFLGGYSRQREYYVLIDGDKELLRAPVWNWMDWVNDKLIPYFLERQQNG